MFFLNIASIELLLFSTDCRCVNRSLLDKYAFKSTKYNLDMKIKIS